MSILGEFMYGCRELALERDVTERVGEGVDDESHPSRGELGKTLLRGRANAV